MKLEDFKKTKQHTILLECLKTATLDQFSSKEHSSTYCIETTKYRISFLIARKNYLIDDGVIVATIKRPDNDTKREISYGRNFEISEYLKSLFFSEKYELGKWIKACEKDWSFIEGV